MLTDKKVFHLLIPASHSFSVTNRADTSSLCSYRRYVRVLYLSLSGGRQTQTGCPRRTPYGPRDDRDTHHQARHSWGS